MEEMTKLYLCDGHACDEFAYDGRHQSLGCVKNRDGFCMRTSSEEHALHNQLDFPKTKFIKWFPDDSILVEIISELNSEDDSEIEPVVRQWQQKLNDPKES